MKNQYRIGLVLAASLLLTACGSNSNSNNNGGSGRTDFNDFVRSSLSNPGDAEPQDDLDNREFVFSDEPEAFDDLLQ